MATHHRPTTADELLDAAGAIERDARAARHENLEAYVRAGISGRGADDAATRNRLAAQAGADEAARQVEMATGAREMHRSTRDLEVEAAAAARAAGQFAAALEHDEAAQIAGAKLRIAEHQLQEATRSMWAQREEVDRWTPIDDEVLRHADREIERQRLEDVFDTQERRAVDYRNAAADLREAERLEAALPDLEARRVAGVERVREAAAEHRRSATAATERWGEVGPEAAANGADEIEMPPMDMRPGSQEPVGGNTAEPDEIEMPPMDMRPGSPAGPVDGAVIDPGIVLTGATGRATFLESARAQIGDPYRFGAEARLDDADPSAFDSSELVQWAAAQTGVQLPDGSWQQYRHLAERGSTVTVADALRTPGALVFGFSADPLASPDRPARSYVGISIGDGTVLDVSERAGEVRVMDPGGFYTHAAVIPELVDDLDSDGDGETDVEERLFHSDPFDATRTVRDPKYADPPATAEPTGADVEATADVGPDAVGQEQVLPDPLDAPASPPAVDTPVPVLPDADRPTGSDPDAPAIESPTIDPPTIDSSPPEPATPSPEPTVADDPAPPADEPEAATEPWSWEEPVAPSADDVGSFEEPTFDDAFG